MINMTRSIYKNAPLLYVLIVVILALYAIFRIAFTPGSILITGNIHDFLIPANAAYLLEQNGSIHEDFHSPFGYLYFLLNYLSLELIKWFDGSISALPLITSSFFLPVIALFAGLINISVAKSRKIPLWFIAFLIMLALAPRDYSTSQHNVTWYGTYNRHMWVVIFLQIYAWISLIQNNNCGLILKGRQIAVFGIMSGMCLILTFLYKVSFFAVSGMMIAATAVLVPAHFFKYCAITTLTFLTLLILPAITGYSYDGYFHDLLMAVEAKKENEAVYNPFSTLIFLVVGLIIIHKAPASKLSKYNIVSLMFVSTSIFLGIIGDFSAPYFFYALTAALLFQTLYPEELNFKRLTIMMFVVFTIIDALSLKNIVRYVNYQEHGSNDRRISMTINSEKNPARFVIKREMFNSNSFSNWVSNTQAEFFNSTEEQIEYYWFYRSYGNEPVQPPYDNFDYISQVNDGIVVLTPLLARNPELAITTTEFTNPFPFFLNSRIPDNSLHWIHPGTTVNQKTMQELDFSHSDVILMPVFSPDPWRKDLNCSFYMFNHHQGTPYRPFKVDSSWVYFIKESMLNAQQLQELSWFDQSQAHILKSCEVRNEQL
jgi:hypothetical protein